MGDQLKVLILILMTIVLSGCASNIVVSNCRKITVEDDIKQRWLCDKSLSDNWR